MSLDSDVIVDRRRIRRKLTFWRVAAAVVAIAAIVTVGMLVTPGARGSLATSGSIARVNIEGLIRSDQDRVEALDQLAKSSTDAVIVHINSPGGTTAGSEQLYDSLTRLKASEPGERFLQCYQRHQAREAPWLKPLMFFAGVFSFVIGFVLAFIPGPAVMFFALSAALFACEYKPVANAFDKVEVWGRRLIDKYSPGFAPSTAFPFTATFALFAQPGMRKFIAKSAGSEGDTINFTSPSHG